MTPGSPSGSGSAVPAGRACPKCQTPAADNQSRCPSCGTAIPVTRSVSAEGSSAAGPGAAASPAPATARPFSAMSFLLLGALLLAGAGVYYLVHDRQPELQDGSALPARPLPTVAPPRYTVQQAQAEYSRDKVLGHIAQLRRRVGDRSSGGSTTSAWNALSAFERKAQAAHSAEELGQVMRSLKTWESANLP